ncbi:hypothetical protein T02_2451 [Trichinella nativa]|uniref:Uncharacterized protein n=1 Tax=Trichinella nativa TaxID=6335 RepID=A0A0V1LE22_9BILA|nr:hypothetical protein T02_2451 [Trichinella nativa]
MSKHQNEDDDDDNDNDDNDDDDVAPNHKVKQATSLIGKYKTILSCAGCLLYALDGKITMQLID